MSTVALINQEHVLSHDKAIAHQSPDVLLALPSPLFSPGRGSSRTWSGSGTAAKYDVVPLAGKRVQIGEPSLPSILAEARNRSK